MPRTARIVVMGYPLHIIQRGHNKQVVFASDEDYQYYLDNLCEWKEKLGCKVYACCLMTHHVHLIVDPGEDGANLARLMKRVAGRQTRYLNMGTTIHPICSSEYASEALEDFYATIRRGRNGQGSLPCSTPLQSRAGTSPASLHFRRLQPGRGVRSLNRRSNRHECRST